MKILVKVLRDDQVSGLEIDLVAGEAGLSRSISNARVQRPGLALTGFVESVRDGNIQVVGATEMHYLKSLDDPSQASAFAGLCAAGLSCVIVTRGLELPGSFLDAAHKHGVALFTTPLQTEAFMNRLHNLLDQHLSPETTRHGVLLDVFGVGLMLMGQSGIGKSECALDLILRGHRLIADDVVIVKQQGRQLIGMGSPLTRHHMEVRGLGIINVQHMFGAAAVRETKRIEQVVELVEWQPEIEYDRLGIDDHTEVILDNNVAKIRLPIRPGRNVASIVEVAARNHLLKAQGHHSAREFKEALERRLATEQNDLVEAE